MRRTYRSKRDMGGGLDPKDLLSNVDAKSSVFDAFYIQNIKQTKREVSYFGSSHYNKATYKVNKKKYVKRIIKNASLYEETEDQGSASRCAYLTPDKSIHVNKAPDPFDLLLKSSPPLVQSTKLAIKTCKNTYEKKKGLSLKNKESADSDKENSVTDLNKWSENMSDIKNHELIIEKVNSNSSKCQDESINNIVKQISFLTNIQKSWQSSSTKETQRIDMVKNLNPTLNSPLSSTPFQQKYRRKSIFNISPISFNLDSSLKSGENNSNKRSFIRSQNNDKMQSTCECLSQSDYDINFYSNNKKDSKLNLIKKEEYDKSNSVRKRSFDSSLCTTEIEPFYGFEKISNFKECSQKSTENLCSKINSLENATTNNSSCESSNKSINNSTYDKSNGNIIENNDCASFYDTCNSDELCVGSKSGSIYNNFCSSPRVVVERMQNSLFYKYYTRMDSSVSNTEANTSRDHELICSFHSNSSFDEQDNSGDIINGTFNSEINHKENVDYVTNNCIDKEESMEYNNGHESNITEEEDTSISFVTTRRGNRKISNSIIFIDDNFCYPCNHNDDDAIILCSEISPDRYKSNCDNILHESTSKRKTKASSINNTIVGETIEDGAKEPFKTETKHEQITIERTLDLDIEPDKPIVLQPGKKWERSLSIYKRMTSIADSFDHTILDDENHKYKGRRYRQSVINTMELQKFKGSLHNESINGRRSTFMKPSRSTIKIVKENRTSGANLCSSTVYDDLKGFLSEDCDDTIVDLSKLSINDSVHEVTVLEKFHDTSRIASARDYVLRRCNQTEALLFDECYPDTELKNCHKIGEGVYGEVFLWRARDGQARVLKIIPIAGDIKVNGEPQKGFHEIISEIVIAMELSALRSPIAAIEQLLDEGKELDTLDLHSVENATDIFNEVVAVRCVRGAYPARLLDLWELFDECRGSDNDNPALLPADQHFVVLELANAGQDLEGYHFANAEQAHALFLQVALGLAVGEEALQFEHRDLHWGNVLVAPCERRWACAVVRGRAVRVARKGVRATLIDYSLSRLSLRGGALFADLAHDEALFEAVGDRQFAVYRLMRERLANDWSAYDPHTNVLWLHYLLDKMLTALRYRRTNTKLHKHFLAKLRALKARILDYGSAAHFVLTDDEF